MPRILNNISFSYVPYELRFKFDAGTSRGVLKNKLTYFIKAKDSEGVEAWGEAAPLPKLSIDDVPDFENQLKNLCEKLQVEDIEADDEAVYAWVDTHIPNALPSIRFAFETALLDLIHGGQKMIFASDFYASSKPIPINGLIWMGDKQFMLDQIDKKLEEGFDCIKMKIGAIDFEQECALLEYIRNRYSPEEIVLRVDANGAFSPDEALNKLRKLATYGLHSIEQPIAQGQIDAMAELCSKTPLPIALDEELIGVHSWEDKNILLETIKPQYIILKPTLVGGLRSCREWIALAESKGIGWWMTSALESNVGLNAISQFTSTYPVKMPQGLGTGQLYHNNISSPLVIRQGQLVYDTDVSWADVGNTVGQ